MVYFRIPQLKTKILSSIKIPDDIIVQEWRGTEYALEDEVLKVNSKIDSMFDWDNKFYSFI